MELICCESECILPVKIKENRIYNRCEEHVKAWWLRLQPLCDNLTCKNIRLEFSLFCEDHQFGIPYYLTY